MGQHEIYQVLLKANGPMTTRDIVSALGGEISLGSVQCCLKKLALREDVMKFRTIWNRRSGIMFVYIARVNFKKFREYLKHHTEVYYV